MVPRHLGPHYARKSLSYPMRSAAAGQGRLFAPQNRASLAHHRPHPGDLVQPRCQASPNTPAISMPHRLSIKRCSGGVTRAAAAAAAGGEAATSAVASSAAGTVQLPGSCSALIVGGGPAGLAAALQLSQRGWRDVVVLERRDSVVYADMDRCACQQNVVLGCARSPRCVRFLGWRTTPILKTCPPAGQQLRVQHQRAPDGVATPPPPRPHPRP